MQSLVESMAFCDKERRTLLPFQKGILISIKATKEIYLKLKQQLSISYLLTHRFNQDYMENKFSRIRGVGGDGTHPGPVQAMNRIRSLELISNAAKLVSNPVVQIEADQVITPGIEDDLGERELSDGIPVEENVIQDDVSDADVPLPLRLPNPVEVLINYYLKSD